MNSICTVDEFLKPTNSAAIGAKAPEALDDRPGGSGLFEAWGTTLGAQATESQDHKFVILAALTVTHPAGASVRRPRSREKLWQRPGEPY